MNWKFWQRNKGDSLDYGRIERHEQFKRESFELENWLSNVTDRSSSINTRTPYGKSDNPWAPDSLAIPCVAVSRVTVTDARDRYGSYAPCVLPMNQKGDHALSGSKPWVEDAKPARILVHEAIGEIHGPEGLKQLKQHFKDEAREAKRKAKAKYDHIVELGEKYYPEA